MKSQATHAFRRAESIQAANIKAMLIMTTVRSINQLPAWTAFQPRHCKILPVQLLRRTPFFGRKRILMASGITKIDRGEQLQLWTDANDKKTVQDMNGQ